MKDKLLILFFLFFLSSCATPYYSTLEQTTFVDEEKDIEYVFNEGVDFFIKDEYYPKSKRSNLTKLYVLNADFKEKLDTVVASRSLSKRDSILLQDHIRISSKQFRKKRKKQKALRYKGLIYSPANLMKTGEYVKVTKVRKNRKNAINEFGD